MEYVERKYGLGIFSGVPFALVYGFVARSVFGAAFTQKYLGTLTLAFLFLVPFALGALTVFFAPRAFRRSISFVVATPWLTCLMGAAVVTLFAWEALICIAMAFPLMMLMASTGGLLASLILKLFPHKSNAQFLAVFLLAPYLVAPVENQFPLEDSVRTVHTQIEINADAATVWRNIIRVPRIGEPEQSNSVIYWLGIPRPVEATLSEESIHGVRHASFANGLLFVESIDEWEAERHIRFQIAAANKSLVPPPFGEIGGKYFAMLDGSYTLEPLGDGHVLLHLSSHHRLSTHFNAYGGLWTDFFMREIQNSILRVVKARAESQSRGDRR